MSYAPVRHTGCSGEASTRGTWILPEGPEQSASDTRSASSKRQLSPQSVQRCQTTNQLTLPSNAKQRRSVEVKATLSSNTNPTVT